MADRVTIIMQLGVLQAEAAQRGDDRAAVIARDAAELLIQAQSAVEAVEAARAEEERRRDDARRRKRKSREMSHDVTAGHAKSRDSSLPFSPTPPFSISPDTTQHTAREAAERLYAESVENLTALVTARVVEFWPDIDAFLRRREYATWGGWMKEMLTSLTGGKATVEDLAQVCRDDEALTRRIGSPKGLRLFLASAIEERTQPAHKPRVAGGVANRTFANGRGALEGLP